jgi:uncharacterized protein (TIGR03382 family)
VRSTLRRWLWAQESTRDDLAGALIAGVAVLLIFRFLFGDGWAFSLGGGIAVGLASLAFSWLSRRRKQARRLGSQ